VHSCSTGVGVCVRTFPLSWGPFSCNYTCDPLSLEEEECRMKEQREEVGSQWYLLTNTEGNCAKKKGKKTLLLCAGPFVLSNQRVLWSLCSHNSASPAVIYRSFSASSSHTCTLRLGIRDGLFTTDIRCLFTCDLFSNGGKLSAFITLKDGF